MAAVLEQPKGSKAGAILTGKKTAPESSNKEGYVIYSIYYTDEPDGGYAVYSNTQTGWAFSGYMPAKQRPRITEPGHGRFNINLL
ncbi:MAG TPA: hypothetical protein VK671_05585 [Mucilaginibacter sp.]|nr:hypothetical protein [Mucilaginibacter sp.]